MSNFLRNLFGEKQKAGETKDAGGHPKPSPSSSSSSSSTPTPAVIPTVADDESMT